MRCSFGIIGVFAIASGLWACNQTRTFSYANEGSLCLNSNADGTLEVEVWFPTCLSSTCDEVLGTSCTIAVLDHEISITSSGSYESPVYGSCSADCQALIADCSSEGPLNPGEYTLVHGEDAGEVTLPADAVALFEQGFFFCDAR
jgi:hypothetical protein